ncbi:MAG: hypothetical protein ACRCTP_17835 [Aeromonas popoffii]|uniref:hypothetical protein n=1 Tax=Aeromonas popoffii TaxID=70856 RepID=UPI003F385957
MTKQPYQGSARQKRRLAQRNPNAQPARTAVKATCLSSGNVYEWSSIRKAADEGGFDYTSLRNALTGKAKGNVHAGHRFEASTPLRQTKPTSNVVKIAEMRNKGMGNVEIAKVLGFTTNTVAVYACHARNLGLTKTLAEVREELAHKNRINFITI